MTTWRDDSAVSRVNQAAGRAPVHVGPETLGVIQKSRWISDKSGGVFDITFEVMLGSWRFEEDADSPLPKPAAVAERRKLIDYRHVVVEEAASSVFLDRPTPRSASVASPKLRDRQGAQDADRPRASPTAPPGSRASKIRAGPRVRSSP
jgi:hypothetical protein